MELVPFNHAWADSGNKLDLKGIYQGKLGDDRLVVLPVRRHSDWARKGLTFVTLATAEDAAQVKEHLRASGCNLQAIQDSYERGGSGPFKVAAYLAQQPDRDAIEAKALEARLSQIKGKDKKGAA
jgi:hypothetical protein